MFVVPPPAVDGLGNAGGFKLQVQDREGLGEQALYGAVWGTLGQVYGNPKSSIGTPYSTYDINVPQLYANVDRVRAKQMGVNLGDIYDTMQVNLGSLYVNDFTKFGKTYQVIVQADAPFRADAQAISRAEDAQRRRRDGAARRADDGRADLRPDPRHALQRLSRRPTSTAPPNPGFSSGQAEAEIETLLKQHAAARHGLRVDRAHLPGPADARRHPARHEDQVPVLAAVMMIAVLLVVLVLAAQYESWSLPMAIVLIVPMCVLAALFGVWLSHFPPFAQPGDLNIFTQVALVVLVGLACKNAILIVEFAKELEERGEALLDAVIHACRMRLRPILMTSIAFCAGVLPLIFGSGAGSEMRRAMGIAVFSGMLGVTLFGIFLTPVFYVLLRGRRREPAPGACRQPPAAAPVQRRAARRRGDAGRQADA